MDQFSLNQYFHKLVFLYISMFKFGLSTFISDKVSLLNYFLCAQYNLYINSMGKMLATSNLFGENSIANYIKVIRNMVHKRNLKSFRRYSLYFDYCS